MKRRFCTLALITVLGCSGNAAGTVGDVDGDDTIGLSEAIYALKVTSGMAIAPSPHLMTYNFLDYYYQDNSIYLSRRTTFAQDGSPPQTSEQVMLSSFSSDNGETVIELDWGYGTDYVQITDGSIAYTRFSDQDGESFPNPPITFGETEMKVGDSFVNAFQFRPLDHVFIREYRFLGFEDVTTPAGTFTNCMKILREDLTQSHIRIDYYAKGVGRVKKVLSRRNIRDSHDMYSYIEELVSARVNGTSYGENWKLCRGTVDLSDNVETSIQEIRLAVTESTGSGYQGKLIRDLDQFTRIEYSITSQDLDQFQCQEYQGQQPYTCLSLGQNVYYNAQDDPTPYPITLECEELGSLP